MKVKKKLLFFITIVFSIIFVISTSILIRQYLSEYNQKKQFDQLRQIVTATDSDSRNSSENDFNMLPSMYKLYEQNNDLVGWIKIEGTQIDYPVMYTPRDSQFYLRKAYDETYSKSGTPFIGTDSTPDSANITIYSHNMFNGTMFADLLKYRNESFYKDHKQITFNSLYKLGTYEIIGVLETRIFNPDEEGLRYYEYPEFESESSFEHYLRQVKALSIYSIEETATYGDQLITLSTCTYDVQDGRFVIIAKRK